MKPSRLKQQTPKELTDALLDFLARKFYQGDMQSFMKDRSRLLAWVVLWPASWLNKRGVSLPSDKYREMFFKVFFEAQSHAADKIKYRPAWLMTVIQSHFAHHGDEIYEGAKSIRSVVEHIVLSTGKRPDSADAHPTDDMSRALQIVATKAKPRAKKPLNNEQLTML